MTVEQKMPLICLTVVPISGVIDKKVVRIAYVTGIGYRQDKGLRLSNKQFYAQHCQVYAKVGF